MSLESILLFSYLRNVQCGQLQCMWGNFLLIDESASVTVNTVRIGSNVCRWTTLVLYEEFQLFYAIMLSLCN